MPCGSGRSWPAVCLGQLPAFAAHCAALVRVGVLKNGMKRGDNGHSQFAQSREDVTTLGPAGNTELALEADHIHIAVVEKVRGAQVVARKGDPEDESSLVMTCL
jgi:hypothetical protein